MLVEPLWCFYVIQDRDTWTSCGLDLACSRPLPNSSLLVLACSFCGAFVVYCDGEQLPPMNLRGPRIPSMPRMRRSMDREKEKCMVKKGKGKDRAVNDLPQSWIPLLIRPTHSDWDSPRKGTLRLAHSALQEILCLTRLCWLPWRQRWRRAKVPCLCPGVRTPVPQ